MHRRLTLSYLRPYISAKTIGNVAALMAFTAVACFAQTSSFGTATQGFATEMVAIAKWVGIMLVVGCGLAIAAGGHGAMAKGAGLLAGLALALFAAPMVAWVQSL